MLKNLILAAGLLTTFTEAQAYNYSWYGAGADAGSFAYFDTLGYAENSGDYSTIKTAYGVGYTAKSGFFAINDVIVPTDRYGMLHPSTGISEGFVIYVPGTQNVSYVHGGIDFFLPPGVLGYNANTDNVNLGTFGTFQTYGHFMLVPGGNPYSGEYAVDPTSKNGSLTIAQGPLPEPSTWALLITGFGLVGAALRRRATTPRTRSVLSRMTLKH